MFHKITKLLLTTIIFASSFANADYVNQAKKSGFINEMVNKYHFERSEVEQALRGAKKQNSILKAISRPAEKAKPWSDYQKIFLTEARLKQGLQFWKQYSAALAEAESQFGVPAQYIVAIIGVETSYGRNMGNYRVLDALATLAFDYPKRSEFFTKELKEYFLLSREQQFNVASVKGSYAGAMGFGQFMPSSYRNYAVDFDGDGITNIWSNPVDAIGSVANYFYKHGWKSYSLTAVPASVSGSYFNVLSKGLRDTRSLSQLMANGWEPTTNLDTNYYANDLATTFELDGIYGKEYYFGFNNFQVITRYNLSNMYALSVDLLAGQLYQAYHN